MTGAWDHLSRRSVLASGLSAAGTGLVSRAPLLYAADANATADLGALAASKGLLFGASFSTYELDKPYGAAYANMYRRDARILTSELELKMFEMRPAAHKLDFGPADRLVAFAGKAGFAVHGHTLIWNDGLPEWIKALAPGQVEHLLEAHILSVLERYKDDIPSWDVVNEPIGPWDDLPGNLRGGPFYAALGEDYIAKSFKLARKVAPKARLVLNEAQTESDDENGQTFRDSFLALVRRLKDQGAPIDVIGLECHLDSRRPYDFPRFAGFLETLADLGFELAISELDVNDAAFARDPSKRDAQVADLYRRFLTAVLPVRAVRRLTTWQLADHTSWLYYDDVSGKPKATRRPRPLPYDNKFQRKPAWYAIAEALDAAPHR